MTIRFRFKKLTKTVKGLRGIIMKFDFVLRKKLYNWMNDYVLTWTRPAPTVTRDLTGPVPELPHTHSGSPTVILVILGAKRPLQIYLFVRLMQWHKKIIFIQTNFLFFRLFYSKFSVLNFFLSFLESLWRGIMWK